MCSRCLQHRRARAADIPVIYANDNFGRWRSDFREVVEHCLHDGVRGQVLAETLHPDPDDYFVLKPKHSAFFATTMELLLAHLGVQRLILTGVAGDACVFMTACDAHLRGFRLHVPADCVASIVAADNQSALAHMQRTLHADISSSAELDFARMQHDGAGER